ncbi:MAG: winged helix-turn-helix transcriptional regulator [Actinobacteria bacterium]|nr:winged helix-turn-helix transcriptional regulator [Actinomycetota bacterium]
MDHGKPREADHPEGSDVIDLGRLEIRPDEYAVTVDGERLALTVRELQLLVALARRRDRIVTREELYAAVWRKPYRPDERSVDVYVRKLRRKLAFALPGWEFIHTHFGFGYRLSPSHSQVFHTPATRG